MFCFLMIHLLLRGILRSLLPFKILDGSLLRFRLCSLGSCSLLFASLASGLLAVLSTSLAGHRAIYRVGRWCNDEVSNDGKPEGCEYLNEFWFKAWLDGNR